MSIFTMTDQYRLSNKRFSSKNQKVKKIQAKPLQDLEKLDDTMANELNNLLYFHSGVDKVVRFLEDDKWW